MDFDGYIRGIVSEIETDIKSAEAKNDESNDGYYTKSQLHLFQLQDELKMIKSCIDFDFEDGIKDQFPFVKFLVFASEKYGNHYFGKRLSEWKRGSHSFASIQDEFLSEATEWMRYRAEQLRDEAAEEQFERNQGDDDEDYDEEYYTTELHRRRSDFEEYYDEEYYTTELHRRRYSEEY